MLPLAGRSICVVAARGPSYIFSGVTRVSSSRGFSRVCVVAVGSVRPCFDCCMCACSPALHICCSQAKGVPRVGLLVWSLQWVLSTGFSLVSTLLAYADRRAVSVCELISMNSAVYSLSDCFPTTAYLSNTYKREEVEGRLDANATPKVKITQCKDFQLRCFSLHRAKAHGDTCQPAPSRSTIRQRCRGSSKNRGLVMCRLHDIVLLSDVSDQSIFMGAKLLSDESVSGTEASF